MGRRGRKEKASVPIVTLKTQRKELYILVKIAGHSLAKEDLLISNTGGKKG